MMLVSTPTPDARNVMDSIQTPDSDLDDESRPRVKIPPPIFKELPGERPDAHLLATEDWMEAMRVKPDDYIDKFKHTLQHLAHEWYHCLDTDQFCGQ